MSLILVSIASVLTISGVLSEVPEELDSQSLLTSFVCCYRLLGISWSGVIFLISLSCFKKYLCGPQGMVYRCMWLEDFSWQKEWSHCIPVDLLVGMSLEECFLTFYPWFLFLSFRLFQVIIFGLLLSVLPTYNIPNYDRTLLCFWNMILNFACFTLVLYHHPLPSYISLSLNGPHAPLAYS